MEDGLESGIWDGSVSEEGRMGPSFVIFQREGDLTIIFLFFSRTEHHYFTDLGQRKRRSRLKMIVYFFSSPHATLLGGLEKHSETSAVHGRASGPLVLPLLVQKSPPFF